MAPGGLVVLRQVLHDALSQLAGGAVQLVIEPAVRDFALAALVEQTAYRFELIAMPAHAPLSRRSRRLTTNRRLGKRTLSPCCNAPLPTRADVVRSKARQHSLAHGHLGFAIIWTTRWLRYPRIVAAATATAVST